MKLKDIIQEQKLSGELGRIRKLFVSGFKSFVGGKSRDTRLDFIENVVDDTLTKAEIKFLILRLQKGQQKKKKKE
jgi:hypothetical protein